MKATQKTDPLLADLMAHAKPALAKPVEEHFIPSSEFATLDVKHEWMIQGTMVRYEPMVLGGPKKALKTSIVLDLALSLAAGFKSRFLGKFEVKRPYRVGVISGESGIPTLQRKALAMCAAKGLNLTDLPVHWRFRMPQLSIAKVQDALAGEVQEYGLEVLIFDPMYLALMSTESTANAGNVLQMGPLLQKFVDTCLPYGCTPVLVHHTKKLGQKESTRPLDLDDLSQSGFAEFARQWLLLSRRSEYQDGSGEHELWLRTGGSAGHGGKWGLDIDEGKTLDGLAGSQWKVVVRSAKDVKNDKYAEKAEIEASKAAYHMNRVIQHLESMPDGDTKTGIKDALKVNSGTVSKAIEDAVDKGAIEAVEVAKGGKSWPGYRIRKAEGFDYPDNPDNHPDSPDGQSSSGS